ncbi:MAG: carbonic anhydrase [Candidatus Polarisedimenticolia bacterium]
MTAAETGQNGRVVHVSASPWDPSRPPALVICCVDGRWFRHIEEFVRESLQAGHRTDWLCVPGGVEPLTLLDFVPKDFNFMRRRLEGLVQAHGTARAILIGHQDCAWYKQLKLGPLRLDLRARQLKDLQRASRTLREMFPSIAVETYFARLSEEAPQRVQFEAV